MRILALDSSGLVASVAIVEEEQVLAEYSVNYKKTHSQTLLPMLDEIVQMTEQDLGEIDAIAIAGDRAPLPDFGLALPQRKDWDLRLTNHCSTYRR